MNPKNLLPAVLVATLLLRCAEAPAQVVISEFMAANTRTLKDEDGTTPDWIEIRNQGPASVSLQGWSLTDSASNRRKWTFPATNLGSGEFMVVFASDKNRRQPGLPLHTNFKLSDNGEYLALMRPDGVTIATEFSPAYPPQFPDVSYGYGMEVQTSMFVASNAPARWRVPRAGAADPDDASWEGGVERFDDSGWSASSGPVGYSIARTNLTAAASLGLRLNFDDAPVEGVTPDSKPAGVLRSAAVEGAGWTPSLADAGAPPVRRNGVAVFDAVAGGQLAVTGSTDINQPRGTIVFWMRSDGNRGPGSGEAVLLDRRSTRGLVLAMDDAGRLLVQVAAGPGIARNTFRSTRSVTDGVWHSVALTYEQATGATVALHIDGTQDTAQANSGPWTWDTVQPLEIGRSHDASWKRFDGALDDFRFYKRVLTAQEIGEIHAGDGAEPVTGLAVDVGTAMRGEGSSLLLRIPFRVDRPELLSLLTLDVRYDDGYVAYINGQEVARDNASGTPGWASTATEVHRPGVEESITFGNIQGLLKTGTNVLAIHGLNLAADDEDFLLSARLTGTEIARQTVEPRFFVFPTPGAPNAGGSSDLGPIIAEAAHSPLMPSDADDLQVTARVSPSFKPLQSVLLRYRVMFGPTNSIVMLDDGQHGDGAAGDGLFGAAIPAAASTNGQLVRYFISASDTGGATSRWPLFEDPSQTEEYAGTAVSDPSFTTRLPVYQLFVRTPSAMDTDAGTRASFVYQGQLYDNIFVRLKGNTTKDLNKKAHRLDFLKIRPFKFAQDQDPVLELALNAEYIDPSFLRQNTSFWLFNQAGTPAPQHFPVRLQLNGQFHELAFHTETMDDPMIRRMGLNPKGALYKGALMLNIIPEPVIGNRDCREAEKQTRLDEDFSDLIAWTTGIAENRSASQRHTHLFDTTDIPSVINYLACFHLTQQGDGVHANVCPHRDTGGTDEWRLIPWDMNLSMGQVWAVDHVAGNEDSRESHPFYGASGWRDSGIDWSYNRLFDSLIVVPETREMYLRRLRTLMDEWLQPPGTPEEGLALETRIRSMRELIEPEALADRKKWGWPIGYGGYAMTNVPFSQGVDELLVNYVRQRRTHFYGTHSTDNSSYANRAGIPRAQPVMANIVFGAIEASPSGGRPLEEFVELRNTNTFAVDVSGWELRGTVQFRFRPGTVIASGRSLHVSPDVRAFRARTSSPKGGEGHFVQGPYVGRLASTGGELRLVDRCERAVATTVVQPTVSQAQRSLRISAVMYHPAPPVSGPFVDEDFEYLELANIGNEALDLAGVRVSDGVLFEFPPLQELFLPPDHRIVLVKNLAAFRSRYGDQPLVGGVYAGSLNNAGETLRLEDAAGGLILTFTYQPDWQPTTDGLGFALVVPDLTTPVDEWNDPGVWQPANYLPGVPPVIGPGPDPIPRVIINEVLSNPVVSTQDAIELFNPEAIPADISHWLLTDDISVPGKYRIPAGTILPPQGYLVVREAQFNPFPGGPSGFALSAFGETVGLFSADAVGRLTGYSDRVLLPPSPRGMSLGRVRQDRRDEMRLMQGITLGAANTPPRPSPLVISEIHYHPAASSVDGSQDEFVEVANGSGAVLRFSNPDAPGQSWKLTGDVEFAFPGSLVLSTNELAVVVGFDPERLPAEAAAFRARWDMPANVPLLGPWIGSLDRGGGTLTLKEPAAGLRDGGTGEVTPLELISDTAVYDDSDAWPELADGSGPSLRRKDLANAGIGPSDWRSSMPSPGRRLKADADIVVDRITLPNTGGLGGSVLMQVEATGAAPLRYQWRLNKEAVPGANGSSLRLDGLRVVDSGCYDVVVMAEGGVVVAVAGSLDIQLPPIFTKHPLSGLAVAGTNLTLTAGAIGSGPIRYQWFRDGQRIPLANSPQLVLNPAQVDQSGVYTLVATDDVGSAPSDPARLTIAVPASVASAPQAVTAVAGETVVFSVVASGTGPFTYRWRKGTTTLSNATVRGDRSFLILTNVQAGSAGSYSVLVANVLGNARTTPTASLTLLTDTDGDGMPDAWESRNGLNPSVADSARDGDGDGMTDLEEYLADTDPRDANSRLLLSVTLDGFAPRIGFLARSNHTYTVQYQESLPGSGWKGLFTVAAGPANRQERISDTNAPADSGARYYRVVSPAQP